MAISRIAGTDTFVWTDGTGNQQWARVIGSVQVDPTTGLPFGATGAPPGIPTTDAPIVPLGHQTVTVTNAAATLAALLTAAAGAIASVPAAAREIWLWPVTGDVVFTLDGSTPVKATDATLRGSLIAQDMQRSLRLASASAIGAVKLIADANVVLSIEFRG